MKRLYIAVSVTENNKHYAFIMGIKYGTNLLSYTKAQKNAFIFHLCESKKQAIATVEYWNACYKANGTYLFDNPQF